MTKLTMPTVLFLIVAPGPLRSRRRAPGLVVARLYAWKSAKWVKRIELVYEDGPGFRERGVTYSNHRAVDQTAACAAFRAAS